MSHIDVPRAATHAYVGSIEELGRRLEPSVGADYCEACDVPELAPPESFFAKIAAASAALRADEYVDAARKASEAVEILRDLLSAEVDDAAKVEILLQRLLLPALLDLLRRGEQWARANDPFGWPAKAFGIAYTIAVVLMMLDRRVAEFFPDAFAGHRMAALLGDAASRWKDASDGGDFDTAWPFNVVDALGPAVALANAIFGLESERLQLWLGYGWDAPDDVTGGNPRAAAERALSLWWERHPDFAVAPGNYERAAPAPPGFALGITLVPLSETQGGPSIAPFVEGDISKDFELGGDWKMTLSGGGGASGVRAADAAGGTLDVKLAYGGKDPAVSWGDGEGPDKGRSLTIETIEIEGRLRGDPEGLDASRSDARAVIRLKKGKFSFARPDNQFLRRLLPNGIEGTFSAGFGGSVRDGFFFEGGLGTEIFTAVDWRTPEIVGVSLEIPHIRLGLTFKKEADKGAQFAAEAGLGIRLHLGALTFGVGDLGARVLLAHAEGSDGNVGPFDFDWELMEPRSVEFVLAAEAFRGEGFLAHDPDLDRWTGAWRLKLGRFQLDGIVIAEDDSILAVAWMRNLNIPFPGGSIEGLGALVGTNRRGDADAFLAGLKQGVMSAVLFPRDPVGEAPQIVAALTRLFPRADDHLVVGLMVQWYFGGKTRLIVAELGVVLEFGPSGFSHAYILGQGEMTLEHLPRDVYRVNVELFGHWDVEAESFLLRIELRDSRIASGELTGGGLFFYDDAEDEKFIASVGGFNPRYPAPPRFQGVPRVTAHLSDRPSFKLYFELYIAVTSSSIQVGGKLAIRAEIKGFVVEGYLALDVLIKFDGEFFLDVAFFIALKRGSKTLASLEVAGTLAGMSIWSLTGRVTLKILFFKVSLPIEWKSGNGAEPAPAVTDGQAALVAALKAPEAWVQEPRARGVALVDRPRDGVWITPEQGLRVSQTLLPLNETVTRLGASPLLGARRFEIAGLALAGRPVPARPVTERFNLALYRDVDLEEAVRAPFVEALPAGVAVDLAELALGEAVDGTGAHEEIVVDEAFVPPTGVRARAERPLPDRPPVPAEDDFYAAAPAPFAVAPPRFAVADSALNAQLGQTTRGVGFAEARDRVRDAKARDLRRYVVRWYEVAA